MHIRFCRSILGVKRSTNLSALYMELDRKPLIVFRQLRMLNNSEKLINSQNPLLCSVYCMCGTMQIKTLHIITSTGRFFIKTLLDQLGFSNIWLNQDHLAGMPMSQIRQRLFDHCNQSNISSINESHKLNFYRRYKKECRIEQYLDSIYESKYRISLRRFILSSHNLSIE